MKPIKGWRRLSLHEKIERKIIDKCTEAEAGQYYALQELYYETLQDCTAIEAFLLYPDRKNAPAKIYPEKFDEQINFTREEAQKAYKEISKSLEQIREEYFNNRIYKAVEAEFLRQYGAATVNRYPDIFIYAINPEGEGATGEQIERYSKRIDELSKDVYDLEKYIMLEIAKNRDKYKRVTELFEKNTKEYTDELKEDPAARGIDYSYGIIDALIESEWVDEDGNEKADGLFFAALEAARAAKEEADKAAAASPQNYVSVLKDVYKTHIGVDKVQKNIVSVIPTIKELNGQYRMLWAVNKRGKITDGDPVPVYVSMLLDDSIKAKKRITARDETAHDAIITLYCQWMESYGRLDGFYFTTDEVWRVANGYKGNERPTQKQRESFEQSIQKLAAIRLDMDISKEIEANYITINDERIKEGFIKTNVLHLDTVQVKTEKGRTIDAHRLYAEPIFYTYAKARDHILTVKYDLLDTSDTTGNEGNTPEIRRYLLREIEQLYNGTRDNKYIRLETLYHDTAIETPKDRAGDPGKYANINAYNSRIKKEAAKDREKIAAILQSWINKSYIDSFEEVKTGRAITGFKITLNEDILHEHRKVKKQITQKD